MNDPLNAELMVQLKSYLDPAYQDDKYTDPDKAKKAEQAQQAKQAEEAKQAEDISDDTPSVDDGDTNNSIHISHSYTPPFSDLGPDDEDWNDAQSEPDTSSADDNSSSNEPDDVAESVKVEGNSVSASVAPMTVLESTELDTTSTVALLNSREATNNALYAVVKESELWIYYDGSVNLNNTMVSVIELLLSAGYYQLTFNRLARSDNAIVFDIVVSSENSEGVNDEENKSTNN